VSSKPPVPGARDSKGRKARDRGKSNGKGLADPVHAAEKPQRITDAGWPRLRAIEPAAARWISTLIRMASPHPAMTRILEVFERLQDRPYRTNVLLLGEPGTGKDGLGRALHDLMSPNRPLVRVDLAGLDDAEAEARFAGQGKTPGLAEEAHGGSLLIEEAAALPLRVQTTLLRVLKAGKLRRVGAAADVEKRLEVSALALSDRDLGTEVGLGRFRHDLYFRLARIVLWLPPLRERPEDLGPAAIWMGNRILATAGVPLSLRSPEDMRLATPDDRRRAIELTDDAVAALRAHTWPGNFRELEAALERALLLHRASGRVGAAEIMAALQAPRAI
jgi:DNA-binding NtrC family response regulator